MNDGGWDVSVLVVAGDADFRSQTVTALADGRDWVTARATADVDEATSAVADVDCVVVGDGAGAQDGTRPGSELAVVEDLRATRRELPVVVHTGTVDRDLLGDAVTDGPTEYVPPDVPERGEQLAERVRAAVARDRDGTRPTSLYRSIVETVGDPIYTLDADGRFTFVNETFERLTGYGAGDLLGRPVDGFLTESDVAAGRETIRTLLTEADRQSGRFEVTVPTADGEELVCESHVTLLPRGADGTDAGTVGIVRDISARRERERRLATQNERLRTIVDNVPIVLFALDDDGLFTLSEGSGLERLGLEPGEVVGESALDVYADEPEAVDVVERALEGASVHDVVGLSGPTFEVWCEPVDVPGTEESVIGVAVDITERHEQRRRLERQNERLEEFAGIVSHDLRNPLQVATTRLELAGDGEHVARARSALDQMERIVEDVLTLARQGQTVGETEPVSVTETARAVWGSVAATDASLECDTALSPVEADPTRLRELLANLLENAAQHGGDGITVTVGGLDDGFFVADDGPGIPPADRDQVFEHGYSEDHDGTGFGLSIVRSIAEAHDWELAVTDSAAGGARFEFRNVDVPAE